MALADQARRASMRAPPRTSVARVPPSVIVIASARTSPPAPKVTTGLAIVARRPTTLASAAFSTAARAASARIECYEEPGFARR
jgi:hypothetical protein